MIEMNMQRKIFGMTDLKSNYAIIDNYRTNGFFDWYVGWQEIKPHFLVRYKFLIISEIFP